MNELLKKIYESVIYYEKDTVEMGNHVDVEINSKCFKRWRHIQTVFSMLV